MKRRFSPIREFLAQESSSGILLMAAALVGMFLANSPLSTHYFNILDITFTIPNVIELSILKIINYGLMTIFFFVVGLEIKREFVSGHLSTPKKALTPFIAAVGGMAVPALIYLLIAGGSAPEGWAVPVATDIALAVGLLSMMGSRVSLALKTFLLGLAVIDDIGAILIIALVYSAGVKLNWILSALFSVLLILLLQRLGLLSLTIYFVIGIVLWYSLYKSGLHPTLAGVILGLLTPTTTKSDSALHDEDDGDLSWLEWLEEKVHPWSSYLIIPIFALANSGVVITVESLRAALSSEIALGIFLGLVLGKPIGVMLVTWVGKLLRIAENPEGASSRSLFATASSAGIGFTVAIFIAKLAFDEVALQDLAVVAVIAGSIVSGALSAILFRLSR